MILNTYCGYIKNKNSLLSSSSGGLATAMAEKMILENNLVYGVSYCPDFKGAEYIRTDTLEDLKKLKGSKYIKATLNKNILESLAQDIIDGKKILFVGLPCDINIVKSFLSRNGLCDTNLMCVDLICHGPTLPQVAEQYIKKIERKFCSKVVDFSVRYKNPYWTPAFLFAKFKNGKEYIEKFYETDYGIAFSFMSCKSCYNCRFKNNYRSDITIGDYWGSKEGDDGYNKYGSSVAFVHTEKGDAFINSLGNFYLYKADEEIALASNPRYFTSIKETQQTIKFKNNFFKKGLKYAVSKQLSIKQKIKRYVPKRIIKILLKIKAH